MGSAVFQSLGLSNRAYHSGQVGGRAIIIHWLLSIPERVLMGGDDFGRENTPAQSQNGPHHSI